jgi:hypothetical protein
MRLEHSIQVKRVLTRTILSFCQDHKYPGLGLLQVTGMLITALEQGDVKATVLAHEKLS